MVLVAEEEDILCPRLLAFAVIGGSALLVRGVVYTDEPELKPEVEEAENTLSGILCAFVRYDVKLSFLLRREDVRLSFRGR